MNDTKTISDEKLLTPNQITFMIVGIGIGAGFVKLPNVLIKYGQQDSWIAAILGLSYPLTLLLLDNYIITKYPEKNLLQINKDFFGKILGTIFNFIEFFQMSFFVCSVSTELFKILITYIVAFLTPKKILSVCLFICAYTAYKGLKPLAKVNQYVGYLVIIMIPLSAISLKYGSISNLQPVLQTPIKHILKASKESFYFYTAFETLLLIHPMAKDKSSIKKASLKGFLINAIIWIWTVFVTIYYMGIDIIPKNFWSFILVFESIHFAVINNFRYVFMFIWISISLRIVSNFYFYSSFILSDITTISRKKLCILLYIPLLYFCNKLTNALLREKLISLFTPYFVIFNLCLLILISVISFVKSKKETLKSES